MKKPNEFQLSIQDDIVFAAARILNLINEIENRNLYKFLRFENVINIDFFASYPFLVFEPKAREYLDLRFYGFTTKSLEYKNSELIFSNQREKMKVIFSFLVSKDLIDVKIDKKIIIYFPTLLGKEVFSKFVTDFIKGYRISVNYILDIIKSVNQNKLREYQSLWLSRCNNFAIT